ncbi:hypothetical protein JR316_0008216 [Psilocybe cubensis]|uniref:Uncharacterized protein n=2 Tax=Psilocybe cubensis TaxID=181762 RepID=A0A8H7XVY1_PSICU|nr:hypothetical protein JR316_0008216 [Psilocybe cubensis]KAH9479621.1 hypothetical protein JR316_0008216 [Psilocybe cubensis]
MGSRSRLADLLGFYKSRLRTHTAQHDLYHHGHRLRLVFDLRKAHRMFSFICQKTYISLFKQESNSPYCSIECQERAMPPAHQSYWRLPAPAPAPAPNDDLDLDVIYHTIEEPSDSRWTGNDYAGIEAWAAQIPYGAPAGDDSPSSYSSSSAFHQQPQGTPHRASPPALLTSSCRPRTLPPSLSMATPPHVRPPPSHPMQTPRRQSSSSSTDPTAANASIGQTSIHSPATGSSLVSTPYSSQPVPILRNQSLLDGMYSHVRSWVSPAPIHQFQPQTQKSQRTHPSQLISHAPSQHAAVPVFPVRVVSSPQSSCGLSEKSAICWVPTPAVVKQPQLDSKPIKVQRGRKLLGAELAEHPSFRTRGRKASRAAA